LRRDVASNKVGQLMRTVLLSTTVFATVIGAMGLGLLLGYAAILGILRMFGHRQQKSQPASGSAPAAAFVPATHVSGD
jgi:hypothetical protein